MNTTGPGGQMQGSTPQIYTIADCLKWYDDKELVLNPNFQRGAVWSPQAQSTPFCGAIRYRSY